MVDWSDAALQAAVKAGAHAAVSGTIGMDSVVSLVRGNTDGGAHVSIDAVGSPETLDACVRSLRPRGRHVQVGLLLGEDARAAVPMDRVIAKELQLLGAHGMPARDYPELLDFITWSRVDVSQLVGCAISLGDAPGASPR